MAKIEVSGVCEYFSQDNGECFILYAVLKRLRERPGDYWILDEAGRASLSQPRRGENDLFSSIRMCGARIGGGKISEALVAAQKVCTGYEPGRTRRMKVRRPGG